MTIELNREAIAQVTALPAVTEAAEAGSALISLWPLTEAMQMDNDAKYAENLQVRVTRAFARVLTGENVTVPDAEFVYEGADEIPGRPQNIVDTLLAANDAYDTMADYSESGDVQRSLTPPKRWTFVGTPMLRLRSVRRLPPWKPRLKTTPRRAVCLRPASPLMWPPVLPLRSPCAMRC